MRQAERMKDRIRLISLKMAGLGLRLFSKVAPAIAGRCAAFIWFTPPRRPPGPRQGELAALSAVTMARGLRLRSWGPPDGPRVVFVHGWGGRWDQGEALIRALVAEGCRVSAFDFPGHGESPGLSTNISQWIAVLKGFDFGPAPVFVAHSFGFAAVANAVLDGMPARGVVAINPPLGFPFFIEAFRRRARLDLAVVPPMVQAIERRVPKARVLTAVPVEDLARRVPVLYIADRSDREVPFGMHRQAMAFLGDRFVATEGLGHNRVLGSERLIEAVQAFVKENQAEGQSRLLAKACPEPVLRQASKSIAFCLSSKAR
jgi:pimeloyl-ACP methyl ester carboxylesterase